MPAVSQRLPDFPWDTIAAAKKTAQSHAGGIVDLSIGTPVDPTPQIIREALAAASDAPGYPTTYGTAELRTAAVDWLSRRFGVTGLAPDAVLPTIGLKECIASLPAELGLTSGDTVVIPELAYPTYEVGATMAGAHIIVSDSTFSVGPATPKIFYLNSPANPTGRILGADHLRKCVQWARERGVLLVSDECYLEFGWDEQPWSVLHPEISGDSNAGLLALHSLSKRSNLAGYRAAFVAGDQQVINELLAVRKHLGRIVPWPVQQAMIAALGDDAHVDAQREIYQKRRAMLREAFEAAGFTVAHSQGALYLWASRGENCRDTVDWLAQRGILVAPGEFYGVAGAQFVRIAFTATDERIAEACTRLVT